jgi:cytochrome c556
MLAAKAAENRADVEAKAAASAKMVAEHKGKVKDLEALKVTFAAMNKGCGGCHELYRVKK